MLPLGGTLDETVSDEMTRFATRSDAYARISTRGCDRPAPFEPMDFARLQL
jgi:hypothetical protein